MTRQLLRDAYPDRLVRQEGDGLDGEISEFAESPVDKESKTRQADLEASDINKIVKRFERDGILPLAQREGAYLDVSEVPDYRAALEQVRKADEYFSMLPADSRAMFENDPAQFLDVVNDPTQLSLLVKAGVVPEGEVKAVQAGPAGEAKDPATGA